MPILKQITAPNGAIAEFHKAVSSSVNYTSSSASVNVASWGTEGAYNLGTGLVWMWSIDAPVAALQNIDAYLATANQFVGGTVVSDQATSMAARKLRAWVRIKDHRDMVISQPKPTSAGTFDADEDSQNNLNKVIALVGIAAELGLPTTANYTLADNTRSVFTLAQLKMAALEIGGQVQTIFDKADVLRKQIESATTDTQLDAIQWPAT